MRIAIIGAGALGSLFGGICARGGHRVWLYNPSNIAHTKIIEQQGLLIQSTAEQFEIEVETATKLSQLKDSFDLVGIFVKAYDTERAITDILPLIGPSTWTLSLQNGIGPEEILARHVTNGRLLRGVTAQGATLIGPGVVRWGGSGPTHLGLWGNLQAGQEAEIQELCKALSEAGWQAQFASEIGRHLWEKLLINAAINPLTALLRVPNGELVTDDGLRRILRDLIAETRLIIKNHGIDLSLDEAVARVERVCIATASNLSSMLQDVQRGKRTEIEFINGVITREGMRLKIETPLNRLLTRLLMKLPMP